MQDLNSISFRHKSGYLENVSKCLRRLSPL
jgi:hypothetical protein